MGTVQYIRTENAFLCWHAPMMACMGILFLSFLAQMLSRVAEIIALYELNMSPNFSFSEVGFLLLLKLRMNVLTRIGQLMIA